MNKLFFVGVAALAASLFAASPARAEVICELDINPSINPTPPPITVADASGTYHVKITRIAGNSYQVELSGNNDGNPATGAEGTPNPSGSPIPKAGVGRISMNFLKVGGGNILTDGTGGDDSATAYDGSVGVDGNLGGPNNQRYGATGGLWSATGSGDATLIFSTLNRAQFVAPHGGNKFTGTFTLDPGSIAAVQISLQDGGQQWNADCVIVPEPISVALAMPALFPLGMMLLRRRGRKSRDEAEAQS